MTGGHDREAPVVERTELVTPEPAEALAGLVGAAVPEAELPPLWHWVHLLERRPHGELGPDGHPLTGLPEPPGPGQRRMFAGGRVRTQALLRFGVPATRRTHVTETVAKEGRSGPLTFVTVRHEVSQQDRVCVVEDQHIVYRAAESGRLPPAGKSAPDRSGPSLSLTVDEALLFRFSALTYNAHRIHYDRDWARREGYDDLVIHGPLQAFLMGELLRRQGPGLLGATFDFRLRRPLIGPQTMRAVPAAGGLKDGAEVRGADGYVTATATLAVGGER